MPIPHGRFESVVPGKNDSHAAGRRVGAVLAGFSAHVLAAGVLAQTPAPAWTSSPLWNDLEVKWDTNYTWGRSRSESPTRMAADGRGNLYVSNGDSLTVGSPSGTEWRTAEVFNEITNWRHTPVIAGPGGTVLWGSWISDNGGVAWKRISAGLNGGLYSTTAIAPDGYCLFGGSMDRIERSAGLGEKPERMHSGSSYGSIIDFAISPSGNAYASPESDDLLVSRDAGKTWKEQRTPSLSGPSAPNEFNPASGLLALEPAYPQESLWMASRRWNEKQQAEEYVWSGDSLVARRHANLNGPDSAITAFRLQRPVQGPIILWVGTWGQGVYRSADRGESWQAVNSGLKDLCIESLVEGAEGRIFALTRAGLFSLSGNTLGLNPSRKLRPQGRATESPGIPFPFGGWDGRRFRIDGRIGMIPAPEKNIRIDRR
jgi:hypothetical protein